MNNHVIRLSDDAYFKAKMLAEKTGKSVSKVVSEAVISGSKSDDENSQVFRKTIEDLRFEMRKLFEENALENRRHSTKKDLAALFYILAKGLASNRKECAYLGFKMQTENPVLPDFASIQLDQKPAEKMPENAPEKPKNKWIEN